MKFESRFDVGQRVYAVSNNSAYRIIKCFTCDNTGNVTLKGEELVCPKCDGKATERQYAGRKHYVSHCGSVGQIKVEYQPERGSWSDDAPLKIEYMIDATGVGSGTVWREDNLFASREEADAHCNKMNGSLLLDEVLAAT